MLFQTPTFFAFFIILFGMYALTMRRLQLQNLLLLLASYLFYAWWDLRFLSLIIVATAIAFVIGPGARGERITTRQWAEGMKILIPGALVSFVPTIGESWPYLLGCLALALALLGFIHVVNALTPERRAQTTVVTGVVVNLALLGFFKYFNFFADSLAALAASLGLELGYVTLRIVLPVGISFFTFQKLAYIIDIKRGHVEPSRDIIRFGSFVAFFPQLVAGPIERATNLLGQFDRHRQLSWDNFTHGAALFLWGMFKKVVIADNLAPIANRVFADPGSMTSGELLVGLLAFTFQIFCDFSGYTDMARGIARILGFRLMLNFNIPYVSRTPSEFWDRWHISLSSWLRDYLYIPLGGNRGGPLLTYRNLFLTMLLGGLWHGASWTFVAWGAFHGGILIAYRMLGVDRWLKTQPAHGAGAAVRDVGLIAIMFVLTMFGWLLFRAVDMATVTAFLGRLAAGDGWTTGEWGKLAFYVVPLLIVQAWQLHTRDLEFLPRLPAFARLNASLYLVFAVLFLGASGASEFIYFDF